MRKRLDIGVWETFVPGAHEGQGYKFELLDAHGALLPLKADPYGFAAELRPNTASKVARTDNFTWSDDGYLKVRGMSDKRRSPMSIYEVHLGSWRRKAGDASMLELNVAKGDLAEVQRQVSALAAAEAKGHGQLIPME
jgi:1,4-alpha-glucan branching enzyme